jgi:aspartyl protease family protein
VIGWACRQIVIWGAFAALFYALIGHRLLEWPSAPASQAVNMPMAQAPARAAVPNTLVYRADPRGHVVLDAAVNGAPVRFMVDTGATLVALTIADAAAAGIGRGELHFTLRTSTANGVALAAPVRLREIRVGQFSVADVPAVVHENLRISLLGQTFLNRLDSYEMRDGVLTLNWN